MGTPLRSISKSKTRAGLVKKLKPYRRPSNDYGAVKRSQIDSLHRIALSFFAIAAGIAGGRIEVP
jgi:hypothetical protein